MKIGYTYVVGDLLHIGHLKYLQAGRSLCDKLIVGVLTDGATMEKKPKPIISFSERLEIVKSLKFVDVVVKQETYSPLPNVRQLQPDILFESTSHTPEAIEDARRAMKEVGGRVVTIPYYAGQNSTAIKNKILKRWEYREEPESEIQKGGKNTTKTLKKVLALSWISYAIFYFLRVNFSVAIPGILTEFGLSKVALGGALSAFFALYAIGQFVNGQLADNLGPKGLLAVGLAGSVLLSLIIPSFGGSVVLLTILWGLNGVFQSMGWSPTVKIVSAWSPDDMKGRTAGILGTSYIAGGALSWLLAGYLAKFGWRATFYGPTVLAAIVLLVWVLLGKENPEGRREETSIAETLHAVLADRKVWFAGMGLFGLNIVRYGFLAWAPTYFFETQQANITTATYKALVFPLAGAVGALVTGWVCDKILKEKRTLVGLIMTAVLAASAVAFARTTNWVHGLILLSIIGFTTFGPHSLLVSQLPMILGDKKNTASITGGIDALGYVGAAITGVASGWLIDNFSWSYAFYFWVLGALLAGPFIYLAGRRR